VVEAGSVVAAVADCVCLVGVVSGLVIVIGSAPVAQRDRRPLAQVQIAQA
jgi:hypothetical protein